MAIILFIFIIFPCHCAVYMYKIMILQKPLSQFSPKFHIDPTVVMIGLEKCCITSAYQQWLCHSDERARARGPLVFKLVVQTHKENDTKWWWHHTHLEWCQQNIKMGWVTSLRIGRNVKIRYNIQWKRVVTQLTTLSHWPDLGFSVTTIGQILLFWNKYYDSSFLIYTGYLWMQNTPEYAKMWFSPKIVVTTLSRRPHEKERWEINNVKTNAT